MNVPIKIEFREYPSGNWVDWSEYLSQAPSITTRVESDNEGDAGVIVYDSASVEFYYVQGNPVYNAFSGDLSSKQRYMFRISKYINGYHQLYEGMADFSSISRPRLSSTIKFTIVDKLTALGILASDTLRNGGAYNPEIVPDPNYTYYEQLIYSDSPDVVKFSKYPNTGKMRITNGVDQERTEYANGEYEIGITTGTNTNKESYYPKIGDVIGVNFLDGQHPSDEQHLAVITFVDYKDTGSGVDLICECVSNNEDFETLGCDNTTTNNGQTRHAKIRHCADIKWYDFKMYNNGTSSSTHLGAYLKTWKSSKTLYDYNNVSPTGSYNTYTASGYELTGIDGLKIIESMVKSQWSDINIVNKTGSSTYSIPLEYFVKLIDENPFGTDPLGALKYLADTMRCYIYINRLGELVIQSKELLSSNGTLRSIGDTREIDGEEKYFWDKLVDGVEVKVNSWMVDEATGEYLEGLSVQTKGAPGSNTYVKPRNLLKRKIVVNDPTKTTKQELDSYASEVASKDLSFYGKRRNSVPLTLDLDDNTILWELLDRVSFEGATYFFTSITMDLDIEEIEIEFVELQGHDYDFRQVLVALNNNDNTNTSVSSSSATTSGSGNEVDLSFNVPLSKTGSLVQLNYTDNFILTEENKLDTVQPIKVTDVPEFAGLILTGPGYYRDGETDHELYHAGNLPIDNFVTIDTDQTITGIKTFQNGINIGKSVNNNLYELNIQSEHGSKVHIIEKGNEEYGSISITLKDNENQFGGDSFLEFNPEEGFLLHTTIFSVNGKMLYDPNSENFSLHGNILVRNSNSTSHFRYEPENYFLIKSYDKEIIKLSLDTAGKEKLKYTFGNGFIEVNEHSRIGFGANYADGRDLTFANHYGTGSETFTSGWQSGQGWWLESEDLGSSAFNYHLHLDDLTVRGTMRIWELIVQQIRATNGNLLVTATAKADSGKLNGTIGELHLQDYFLVEDVTEHGLAPFHKDDIIICQVANLSGASFDGNGDIVNDTYLIKRLAYRVLATDGLKVAIGTLAGAPANKAEIEKGDGFVRIGNLTDIERRGMVGIYSDEVKAPYIRVTDGVSSWANWKSQDYMQVQIGKLDGLSDPDFGGQLSGYGAYLKDNIYMKGNIFVKSNNQIDLLDNSIVIGNVDISDTAQNAIALTYVDNALDVSGIFGYDNNNDLLFSLRLDDSIIPHNISAWSFNKDKFWNTEGDHTVRLEATNDLTGLGLRYEPNSRDLVKIGFFSTLEPTLNYTDYTSALINGEGFDSDSDYAQWNESDTWNRLNWSNQKVFTGSGSLKWSETEIDPFINPQTSYITQEMANISNIVGKSIDVQFRLFSEMGFIFQGNVIPMCTVSIEEKKPSTGGYWKTKGSLTIREENHVSWKLYNFSSRIDSSATNVRIKILFSCEGEPNQIYGYTDIYLDDLKIRYYDTVSTHINQDGFYVASSPNNYIKFDGSLDIGTSNLNVNGLPVVRWWGNIEDVNYLEAKAGDMAKEVNGNSTSIKQYDGTHWHVLFHQYGSSEVPNLSDLEDVEISSISEGDMLVFNSATNKWINVVNETITLTGHSEQITIPSDGTTSISLSFVPKGLQYITLTKNGQILRRIIDYTLTNDTINLEANVNPFNIEDDVYVEYYT